MNKIRLMTVLALFLSVGLVGCGNDGLDKSNNYVKQLYANCQGEMEVTYHYGTWGNSLQLNCKNMNHFEAN